MICFEYDLRKSESNHRKHGINFEDAQQIWNSNFITLTSKNRFEKRMLVIGKIESKFLAAIITFRGDQGKIVRIISVRRARHEEKELYEKYE